MAEAEAHYTLPNPEFDRPVRMLLVVAPYYRDVADNMIAGARAMAQACGASVDLVEVPGALEIPTAIKLAARMADYDCFTAIGCVIRGETTHYDTVCNDSSRAIQLMGLEGILIGNGILTVETKDQADVRADPNGANKGGGAAHAALHLLALSRKWANRTKGIGFRPSGESFRIAGDSEGSTTA
ncbi:6,7-dimethyl-8-ribityllumazine synthase [Thioclava sp. SK-1]|uniref:6,7-dimethyl-8-ribityllumazine synthase n=1 Tax=Thioclava sp. SK-1 TaxID=1889770 RepID=UPI0008263CDC|nr:6,7-dimethyl-8-ribityllumazine synthase [Thioclava sp. SK-1]OCX66614.1 6,7-dimethyl-8-ribityllumazine synthase [Thioclava sp. SK-1]